MVIALALGCGKPRVHLTLEGARLLNPDDQGTSLPVVVRLYQLSKKEEFENADFIALWKKDREILAQDMQDRVEITLMPESNHLWEVKTNEASKYIAVMALFRKPHANHWRQVVPIETSGTTRIKMRVEEQSITLEKEEARKEEVREAE